MSRKIFVNLPVADLDASMDFFKKVGFTFNPKFTDKTAACMVISDDIYSMLLTHDKLREFSKKEIVDAHKQIEATLALSYDSRKEVDDVMEKALAAGATEAFDPKDYGFMYNRSFNDLDGHMWEIFWMDPEKAK